MVNSSSANTASSSTNKKSISLEELSQNLQQVRLNDNQINELVMNYLHVEGYTDAAVKFSQECSGLQNCIDETHLKMMEKRMQIRNCIMNGNIDQAIVLVNEYSPEILDRNQSLFFNLLQQKLVEMIRNELVEEAIEFAQEDLAPLAEENV